MSPTTTTTSTTTAIATTTTNDATVSAPLTDTVNSRGNNLPTESILPKWQKPPVTKEDVEWANILTVDLSLYDTNKDQLIDTVREALQRDGFFYVVGHEVPQADLDRQFDIGLHAFDGVTPEEKKQYEAPIAEKGTFMGYKLSQYWEINHGVRDRIEHYNFYLNSFDPITRHPQPLRPFVEEAREFLNTLRQHVLRRVLSLIDAVLELPDGYLWSLHETEDGRRGDDLFRYMMYDPLTKEEAAITKGVMLNGHTDFNSISTLISQPVTALQVLMPDGKWRYVRHRDGAMVINIGDQLSFMSGGLLKGTMHRVVTPPDDQIHFRRLGVFHFAHFAPDIPLDLLPSRRVHEEGRRLFEDKVPMSQEWEQARIKSYGVGDFIKGEEYDIETINGVKVRHYH
ncbi:Clavaminate synthase-like protein [Fistulina hepatica ATCC 64428]|uniref:Clavaminate synthase-like protein n=1 Tax=Fistulina hepatica ATCC 64428 TaxID=1128425 RepID=A0A0D7AFE3_9AGAR|nr:Clavaminate synthase-like protein [Fistulina hepatica ATCC 64428]